MNDRKWDLYSISSARSMMFGAATLLIMLFHSTIRIPELPFFAFFRQLGNIGVDIFLFLSAVGLHFSLSRALETAPRTKGCVIDFYKRRALRVLPPLLLFNVIWFAFEGTAGLVPYFSNVLMISFFTQGNRTVWFFALLIFLYIIYPPVYSALKKWKGPALLIMVTVVLAGNYILFRWFPTLFDNIEIATARIPVFLFGAYFAEKIRQHTLISRVWLYISAAAALFLLVMIYLFPEPFGCYTIIRYAYCPLTIALVMVLSAFFARFRIPYLTAFLIWIGGYSLEIYLLQEKLRIKIWSSHNLHRPARTDHESCHSRFRGPERHDLSIRLRQAGPRTAPEQLP